MKKLTFLSAILIAVFAFFTACEAIDAVSYNDRLVDEQNKANALTDELDAEFMITFFAEESASFGDYNSDAYKQFLDTYKKKFDEILTAINEIPDRKDSDMKQKLYVMVEYMKTSLDSYYTPVLKELEKEEMNIEQYDNEFNEKMDVLYTEFSNAQMDLATKNGLELVE
jgi:succinate dehydrogenase flavin-adding protein (antitoxin of CptAB toxin-antitoxin module)